MGEFGYEVKYLNFTHPYCLYQDIILVYNVFRQNKYVDDVASLGSPGHYLDDEIDFGEGVDAEEVLSFLRTLDGNTTTKIPSKVR